LSALRIVVDEGKRRNTHRSPRHLENAILLDLRRLVVGKGSVVASGKKDGDNSDDEKRRVDLSGSALESGAGEERSENEENGQKKTPTTVATTDPCSLYLTPPKKKHMPSTRSKFERMDPRRDD
jgi:hypothetical protein